MNENKQYRYIIAGILSFLVLVSCSSVLKNNESFDIFPFIVYPIEKIRPHNSPDPCLRAVIHLAKNEYEPVIFGLRNDSHEKIHIEHIEIEKKCPILYDVYQVSYYNVKKRSRWFDTPDKRGRWPDPLIPLRSEFPVPAESPSSARRQTYRIVPDCIIPPGENRLFLLDIFLPPDTQDGSGTITLSILLTNKEFYSTTIVVSPRKFSLPEQPTLVTSVKCRIKDITKLHKRKSYRPFNTTSLFYNYYKLVCRYRLNLYISDDPIIEKQLKNPQKEWDWSEFDEFFSPMLDGTIFSGKKKSPVFYFPEFYEKKVDKDHLSDFFATFSNHLKERGWLQKSVYYLVDEPLYIDYPQIRKKAEYIKKHTPGLRVMVTDPFSESLEEVIDVWCVDIPFIGDSIPFIPGFMKRNYPVPEFQPHYPPSEYQYHYKEGKEFWMYTCTSAQVLDYPNLFIDSIGMYHRIIPWLIFKYKGTGFYYWNATFSYKGNPWENQYYFNANGDGTLVYPGLPGMYGSTHHQPFPSLRMVFLREGIEDYEYLTLASRYVKGHEIQLFCDKVVTNSLFWEHNSKALHILREEIADLIQK